MSTATRPVRAAGGVAWLDVSAGTASVWSRADTGPLGLQIAPLAHARAPYFFKGARLQGTRCVWSAATVSGALLHRGRRISGPVTTGGRVQLLVRAECAGSVFEPAEPFSGGVLKVIEPVRELREIFPANTHLFTLDVARSLIGVEPATLAAMVGREFELTAFQAQLLRSAVGLLAARTDRPDAASALIACADSDGLLAPGRSSSAVAPLRLSSAASPHRRLNSGSATAPLSAQARVGVDRYLGALAGLLLRTALPRATGEPAKVDALRSRTDAIIAEQSTDPLLTPAILAAQLNVSLRRLYRAFTGTETPAARIRRRRLEHAAELLASRAAPPQMARIAAECGFVSAEYFTRAFRREFGMSPRSYRATHGNGVTRRPQ